MRPRLKVSWCLPEKPCWSHIGWEEIPLLQFLWNPEHSQLDYQLPESRGLSGWSLWALWDPSTSHTAPRLKQKVTYMYAFSCVRLFAIPWTIAHQVLYPRNSPGKNTGLGCPSLLQGIFLIQGSKLGLLHCRQILYHLSHQGSPII